MDLVVCDAAVCKVIYWEHQPKPTKPTAIISGKYTYGINT